MIPQDRLALAGGWPLREAAERDLDVESLARALDAERHDAAHPGDARQPLKLRGSLEGLTVESQQDVAWLQARLRRRSPWRDKLDDGAADLVAVRDLQDVTVLRRELADIHDAYSEAA